MDDQDLSRLIQTHATRHQASGRLRAELRARIALETAARRPGSAVRTGFPVWLRLRQVLPAVHWRSALAGGAAGALATWLLILPAARLALDQGQDMAAVLGEQHVHALGPGPLIQVASSDRHTVKPWFQGRLDYAPTVLDLAVDGFPLLGGRVESVNGHATAVLVYEHHRHLVDLYLWPDTHDSGETRTQWRGFKLARWSDGGMQYWAVSDMDATELAHFGAAWRIRRLRP
ncbi:MAG: anti-sigma factor [Pseudomonadota bacterium]|nr:anti-sigma factor [Pseudomonadota bacterium]